MTVENLQLLKLQPTWPYKAQLHPCLLASVELLAELRALVAETDRFAAWRRHNRFPGAEGADRRASVLWRSGSYKEGGQFASGGGGGDVVAKAEVQRLGEILDRLVRLRDGCETGPEGLRHGWLKEPIVVEEAGRSAVV